MLPPVVINTAVSIGTKFISGLLKKKKPAQQQQSPLSSLVQSPLLPLILKTNNIGLGKNSKLGDVADALNGLLKTGCF